MLTPTNSTPCAAVAACTLCTSFASTRQSVHHEPQKFSTTTCPRSAARSNDVPSSNVPVTDGAAGRPRSSYTLVVAAPDTNPLSEPFIWLTALVPVEQPTSALDTIAAHAAAAAMVRARTSGALRLARARGQRDEMRRRLGVPDADDLRAFEVERCDARQRALPSTRVVPQPLALDISTEHPDRQLMRNAHRLVPLGALARLLEG